MVQLGDRLLRLRWQRQWSQATLAARAGVDPMVISRLEQRQKPRLEVETAARLAQACGWTLDQLCGLAPIPGLPEAPVSRWYCPLGEAMPGWLQADRRTSTAYRHLAAHILQWQERGARMPQIVTTLNGWGLPVFSRRGPWTPAHVDALVGEWTMGTKKGRKELLATVRQR
jgi:transcriptional regulator with XRE-family HTH domain